MINYINADMKDSADKRAEEARFMADFDHDFAVPRIVTQSKLSPIGQPWNICHSIAVRQWMGVASL